MSSQISTCSTKPGRSAAANSRSGPNGTSAPPSRIAPSHVVARGHLPALVELPVGRQVRLRNDAQHPAAVDHDGGVVDAMTVTQRCADDQHGQQLGGCRDDLDQRLLDGVEQRVLQQDVLDRVAGQRQLREDRQRDAVVVAGAGQPQHRLRVRRRVGDRRVMGASGHPHEPVPVSAIEVHHPLLSPVKSQDPVTGYIRAGHRAVHPLDRARRYVRHFSVVVAADAVAHIDPKLGDAALTILTRRKKALSSGPAQNACTTPTASCWPVVRPHAPHTIRRFSLRRAS